MVDKGFHSLLFFGRGDKKTVLSVKDLGFSVKKQRVKYFNQNTKTSMWKCLCSFLGSTLRSWTPSPIMDHTFPLGI